MDADRFDALTRALTAPRTRRSALTRLGAGTLAALGLAAREGVALGKKGKGAGEGKGKKKCPQGRVRCGGKCCRAFETCRKGKCVDHCRDGLANLGETDVDCGGGDCPPCEIVQMCKEDPDCKSGICHALVVGAQEKRCVECLEDTHCSTDFTRPYCREFICRECRTDAHCQGKAGRPHCNFHGHCVECLISAHCPSGKYCDSATDACVPCVQGLGAGVQAATAEVCGDCQATGCPEGQVCCAQPGDEVNLRYHCVEYPVDICTRCLTSCRPSQNTRLDCCVEQNHFGGYEARCHNFHEDNDACGGCGNECSEILGRAGLCCGGACTDHTTDPNNCGRCGRKCVAPYPFCVRGSCCDNDGTTGGRNCV